MKPYYFSKLFWLGVAQLVVVLAKTITDAIGPGIDLSTWTLNEWGTLVVGLLTIIFRWYTYQPIKGPLPILDKLRPTVIKRLPK